MFLYSTLVLENTTDENTLISRRGGGGGGRWATLDLLDYDTVIGVTCTICNVLHDWSRGQRNEQQNNDPTPKKHRTAGYQGPVKTELPQKVQVYTLHAPKKGAVTDPFSSEIPCTCSLSYSATG